VANNLAGCQIIWQGEAKAADAPSLALIKKNSKLFQWHDAIEAVSGDRKKDFFPELFLPGAGSAGEQQKPR
jgi:hypothetical protein